MIHASGRHSSATRSAESGTETARFIDTPHGALFSVTHRPAGPITGAVLVCSSILTDLVSNYRRETAVARSLSAGGIAVCRFHYRGSGHSEGAPLEVTFQGLVDDARRVLSSFEDDLEGVPVGLIGTRLGACVAASLATESPHSPLAFWEPMINGSRYSDEAFTAESVAIMSGKVVAPQPKKHMQTEGWADILGFPLGAALNESIQDIELDGLIGSAPRSVLYLAAHKGEDLPAADQVIVDRLRSDGFDVETHASQGPKAWWFIDDFETISNRAVHLTTDWFGRVLGVAR